MGWGNTMGNALKRSTFQEHFEITVDFGHVEDSRKLTNPAADSLNIEVGTCADHALNIHDVARPSRNSFHDHQVFRRYEPNANVACTDPC